VVANAGGVGFYRTRYSDDLFAGLLEHLNSLDDLERYVLVADTWAFVKSGQIPSSHFLDLVGAYGDETEQAIWSVIVGGLAAIEHHALEETVRPAFEDFVRNLVGPNHTRLGWEADNGESDLTKKLRGSLISAMGNLGNDQPTIDRARNVAGQLLNGDKLDPEVATAALGVFARHGSEADYEMLWKTYQESTSPIDQVRYLAAVAGVDDQDMAVSTLKKIVNGDIRTQDGFWVFARILSGKSGPAAWESARQRWDEVLAAMPGMTRPRVVEGIPALSQPEVANDVRGFFAENPIPEAARALTQKLEMLEANVKLRERETETVSNYFGG
jgi:puromycin-sensitive aminopeptidase